MKSRNSILAILASTALLGACSQDKTSVADKIKTEVTENIETDMNKAMAEVKADMTDISIDLKDGGKASIAANGDLKINGVAITLNDSQRALTTAYYAATKKLAMQGLEIGKESAKLATQAIGSAIGGIINGKNEADIEKSIEAKAGKIEVVAMKLCDSALELKTIQEKLIIAVPQFTPEPMTVDGQGDGCNVTSGNGPPEPPLPPEPPQAPPEPPQAPKK